MFDTNDMKYSVQGSSGCGAPFRPNNLTFNQVNRYERFDTLISFLMTTSGEFSLPLKTIKETLPFLKSIGQNSDFAFCKIVISRIESIATRLKYGIYTEILHSKDNKRATAIRVKIANIRH